MIDCPCGFGKDIKEDQSVCPICGSDLTPLHRLKALPNALFLEGVALIERKEFNAGLEQLLAAMAFDGDNPVLCAAIGEVYSHKGLHAEASSYYKKALESDPTNKRALEGLVDSDKEIPVVEVVDKAVESGRNVFSRWAYYGLPVAAFALGLIVMSALGSLFRPPQVQPADAAKVVNSIKDRIAAYPALSKLNLQIKVDSDRILLTGRVPGQLEKDLIQEVAQNAANGASKVVLALEVIPPEATHAEPSVGSYAVVSGDTLSSIAGKFYGNSRHWSRIFDANKAALPTPNDLSVGQVLKIPQ